MPHPVICHGVHGPWPRKTFDASAAAAPVASPARAPSVTPVTATIIVTGWTLGIAAKSTRPPAAAAASAATSASSRPRFGPVSIATSPSVIAASRARATVSLDMGRLPGLGEQRDGVCERRPAEREPELGDEEDPRRERVARRAVGQHPARRPCS